MATESEKTKFVIWFEGRSGSSFLVSLLNSHPNILCRGENFDAFVVEGNRKNEQFETIEFEGKTLGRRLANFRQTVFGPTEKQVLEHLEELFSYQKAANGFKFKHSRQSYLFPEICQFLIERRDQIRIIHLQRWNLVKRAISKQNQTRIRQREGRANLTQPTDLGKLHVDIPELLDYCDRLTARSERFMNWPRQFSYVLDVEYADLLSNLQSELKRIYNFLDVPTREVEPRVFKATPDSIEDAVANYEELVSALGSTEYSCYLERDA